MRNYVLFMNFQVRKWHDFPLGSRAQTTGKMKCPGGLAGSPGHFAGFFSFMDCALTHRDSSRRFIGSYLLLEVTDYAVFTDSEKKPGQLGAFGYPVNARPGTAPSLA